MCVCRCESWRRLWGPPAPLLQSDPSHSSFPPKPTPPDPPQRPMSPQQAQAPAPGRGQAPAPATQGCPPWRCQDRWWQGILVLFPKHQSHCPGPSIPEFSKRCPQRTLSTGAASAAPSDPWPWGDQVLPVNSAQQETGSRLSLRLGSGGPRAREPGAGVRGT